VPASRLTKSKHGGIYAPVDLLLPASRSPTFHLAAPPIRNGATTRAHTARTGRPRDACSGVWPTPFPATVRDTRLAFLPLDKGVFNFEQTATPFISPAIPFIRILIIHFSHFACFAFTDFNFPCFIALSLSKFSFHTAYWTVANSQESSLRQ